MALPITSCSNYLQELLQSARPFLRGELESVDTNLPSLVAVLRSVGAGECWHKHGSFLDHLVHIYRILKIWKAPDSICLCGLFHSAYSNAYVNLAIFDPSAGREVVAAHVGKAAERLIYLFCVVPRQSLIHDDLIFQYSDSELVEHLNLSETSLANAKAKPNEGKLENGVVSWRKKVQSLVPAHGLKVKHIKTGEDVWLSRRVVATFLLMTIADFSDQWFSFQDTLVENLDGRAEFKGSNVAGALWPGDGKPGLCLNSLSRMAAVYSLIVREEELFMMEKNTNAASMVVDMDRDENIDLVVPPVFDKCRKVLDAGDQIVARDLYWEAVCLGDKVEMERVEGLLMKCIEKNPFVGEPHVVLSQVYLSIGRFDEAEIEANKGLGLLLEWGSPWDKRMSWEGWVAWSRVLLNKSQEKCWPHDAWGILNLGLVR